MKEEFKELYNLIVSSDDPSKMRTLGHVTKELMNKTIETSPQIAREFLDKLQSIKWNNYLTQKEADSIYQLMHPKPELIFQGFEQTLKEHGFPLEDKPYYNLYALFITMCMIYSDSSRTLQNTFSEMGVQLEPKALFKLIHNLALDKLKDKDEVFDIRSYFDV